jgi:CBS domain containing-hemolysin-like protein
MTRRPGALGGGRHSEASEQEKQILAGLANLRDHTAREVMTPRVDVVSLRAPFHYGDVARAFRRSGHSHFPVYEGDGDHLLGVLFIKDLFHIDLLPAGGSGGSAAGGGAVPAEDAVGGVADGGEPAADGIGREAPRLYAVDADLTKRVREPFAVPESRNALELLAEMRKLRRGFAVIVDEYGAVSGVVTINDLVSELVGDIHDEYDQPASPSIRRIDQTRWLVDGACDIDEVRDTIGAPIPDGEYVTLGGFLFDRFGRIPEEGEELDWRLWCFRVDRMDRRRVAKVVVRAPSATMSAEEEAGDAGTTPDGK